MDEGLRLDLIHTRNHSGLLYTEKAIEAAIADMASAITDAVFSDNPLFLCVLNGAILPYAELLKHLDFPLQSDYIHATRYCGGLSGENLQWLAHPKTPIQGRTVIIVDDILDEGITLAAIEKALREEGASRVLKAVLVQKELDQSPATSADFVGLTVPDRYVFGYGMDYKGYWRNLPGIYAVKEPK